MEINKLLFSRISPEKKIETIDNLTQAQLLSIASNTIERIIREAGKNKYGSRDREFRLHTEYRTGNSWDSIIESWELTKGKIHIGFYFQLDSTDLSISDTFDKFMARGKYRKAVIEADRHGNPATEYMVYDESDKARAIRSLLKNYIVVKYKEKLKLS